MLEIARQTFRVHGQRRLVEESFVGMALAQVRKGRHGKNLNLFSMIPLDSLERTTLQQTAEPPHPALVPI